MTMRRTALAALFLVVCQLPSAHAEGTLSEAVQAKTELAAAQANAAVDAVFESIAAELEAGRSVTIRGFGKFYTASRDARTMRSPRDGKEIHVPKKRYPRFKSSDVLKERMNLG
ncbi:MAG: HU family DNA-binding protein [Bdellovibrionales bacterium]|nr:HU family DNA-binding protein [Bdellovibrionales bacterium]